MPTNYTVRDTPLNEQRATVMKIQRLILAIVIIVYGHNMGKSAQGQAGKVKHNYTEYMTLYILCSPVLRPTMKSLLRNIILVDGSYMNSKDLIFCFSGWHYTSEQGRL
jgi:hypothetical protein